MNTESNTGWKVIIALTCVAVIVSVVLFLMSNETNVSEETNNETVSQSAAPVAEINSIDALEAALLKNVTDENALLDESGDAEKFISDGAALENVGKTYDENNL